MREIDLIRIRDPNRPGMDKTWFDLNRLRDRGVVFEDPDGARIVFEESVDATIPHGPDKSTTTREVVYRPTGMLAVTDEGRVGEVWMPEKG